MSRTRYLSVIHVPDIVDLLHRKPHIAGLFPIADVIDLHVRWNA